MIVHRLCPYSIPQFAGNAKLDRQLRARELMAHTEEQIVEFLKKLGKEACKYNREELEDRLVTLVQWQGMSFARAAQIYRLLEDYEIKEGSALEKAFEKVFLNPGPQKNVPSPGGWHRDCNDLSPGTIIDPESR